MRVDETAEADITPVAWLGLGAMGTRMAGRLLRAGYELTVWNRTPGRADDLVAAGAREAGTPAEAVRGAAAVVLTLADGAAVRAVTEGPGGIAAGIAGLPPAARPMVIDMSTTGPDAVADLRKRLAVADPAAPPDAAEPPGAARPPGPGEPSSAARTPGAAEPPAAVEVLDAPVLGSLAEAESGTLKVLVGGPAAAVARARPLLETLGEPIHLGDGGAGAAAKLVANFALMGTIGVLGESLALAGALGIPRETAWRVLGLTPLAAQAERRRPAVESGAYPPRFALAMAAKDADLIAAAPGTAGLPLVRAVRDRYAAAAAAGLGGHDYTAVLRHILSAEEPAR